MPWTLWYWDGTTVASADVQPEAAKRDFVVCVTQPELEKEKIIVGAAYLLWRADLGRWTQCGEDGLFDQLLLYAPAITAVRKGLWLPEDAWNPIWRRAREAVGMKP